MTLCVIQAVPEASRLCDRAVVIIATLVERLPLQQGELIFNRSWTRIDLFFPIDCKDDTQFFLDIEVSTYPDWISLEARPEESTELRNGTVPRKIIPNCELRSSRTDGFQRVMFRDSESCEME